MSDLLRDKDALRSGLAQLDDKELGVVIGMALSQLNNRAGLSLSSLLRTLSDQVEDVEREGA